MKKVFFAIILFISCLKVDAQNTPTQTIYCEMVESSYYPFKIAIILDMGEDKGKFNLHPSYILNEQTRKPERFNSLIEGLNLMSKKGWRFEQAYTTMNDSASIIHYLLSHEVISGEENNYFPLTGKDSF
jgi:hypothetical protein